MCARMLLTLFVCVLAVSATPAVSSKKAFLGLEAGGVPGAPIGPRGTGAVPAGIGAPVAAAAPKPPTAAQRALRRAAQVAAAAPKVAPAVAAAVAPTGTLTPANIEMKRLQRTLIEMQARHKATRLAMKTALATYARETTKVYSCTDATVKAGLQKAISTQGRIATRAMEKKLQKENQLYIRRKKCMLQIPGDQSVAPSKIPGAITPVNPQVTQCMKTMVLKEKAPVDEDQGLSLYEKVAVEKQTDRFQQMLDDAMKVSATDLFTSAHIWDEFSRVCSEISQSDVKQMQDTWEKDNKKYLQQCEQPTPQ